jgi:hypothetical protein
MTTSEPGTAPTAPSYRGAQFLTSAAKLSQCPPDDGWEVAFAGRSAANRASMPDADPKKWVALSSAAAVIAFLFSDDSRDVSGVALPVYGRV